MTGWSRRFIDPILLPDAASCAPLRDAGNYISRLPKPEHDADEWQAAMRALLLVVERGGDTMLPRIGIMRALHRHDDGPVPAPRKFGVS